MIVTGGSRGIGRAVALLAAERGWDVAISWQRDDAAGAEVLAAIRAHGRRQERTLRLGDAEGGHSALPRRSECGGDHAGSVGGDEPFPDGPAQEGERDRLGRVEL